ncbi:dUTP diphosphatase [Candidatus Woesearchaeota archaeon]|nr:dUTP diphosphatase [Candidatus Woesearchaeota archaeon]
MEVQIVKVDKDLPTPSYQHKGDAGMDLYSAEEYTLQPGEYKIISSGIKVAVPEGYELQVRPRSGMAAKHGVTVLNTPGTIDHQYRGIVGVILINHSKESYEIKKGDRIAQAIFNEFKSVEIKEVDTLDETKRGEGGFGSTGK